MSSSPRAGTMPTSTASSYSKKSWRLFRLPVFPDLVSCWFPHMAKVFPFRPYRYAAKAGDPQNLITQPYDKISPEMQKRYLGLSPHNLVRVILGERLPTDSDTDNVYTRAAKHFREWIDQNILEQEGKPAFYAYFQEFTMPDTGE